MTDLQHSDTHNRLKILETSASKQEAALERMAAALNELASQQAQFLAYQREHDRFAERTGKRLEEIEDKFYEGEKAVAGVIHRYTGIFSVLSVIFLGVIGYLVDAGITVNRELHDQDKRLELLQQRVERLTGATGAAFFTTEEESCPDPTKPKPKPKPDQAITHGGDI